MLILGKETHVVALWYVAGRERDWLACLTRESDGSHLVRYRFRYYKDNEVFDSADEKSWWSASWPSDKGAVAVEAACDMVADVTSKDYGNRVHKVEVNGDGEKAMRLLSEQPFVHFQTGGTA